MKTFSTQKEKNPALTIMGWVFSAAATLILMIIMLLLSKDGISQTFPPATSCTSNDLVLIGAKLETKDCALGGNTLLLGINNKTGSTRTAFALWGNLVVRDENGNLVSSTPISACVTAPVPANSTTYLPSDYSLNVQVGYSYTLSNLFLAWTTANKKEDCSYLRANTANIAPKCGTSGDIKVNVGIGATVSELPGYCASGVKKATVRVTTSGGTSPYVVSLGSSAPQTLTEGGSYDFTDLTPGQEYTFTIKDKNGLGCSITRKITPAGPTDVVFSVGFVSDFTKTCASNSNGKAIGENESGFSYAWTSDNATNPNGGLSATNIGNPTANPSITTAYEVTKSAANGCSVKRSVTVTVNTPTVTANAGSDFTITCKDNVSGQTIGEVSNTDFSYSWNTTVGLSSNVSNPTAAPSVTTTYTLTKTDVTSGCYATDDVTVTVNNTKPSFTVCITQPSLCSKGAVSFSATGGSGFEYSLDGGTTYQGSGSFSNLEAGSVSGFKVRNSYGCESNTVNCGSATSSCTPDLPTEQKLAQSFVETTETSLSKPVIKAVQEISVKAYPNPFSSKVNFNVSAPVAGNGSLELFNLQGQKITTVFQGRIPEGSSTYQYYVPGNSNSVLIYILKVGDRSVTGKLMNLK